MKAGGRMSSGNAGAAAITANVQTDAQVVDEIEKLWPTAVDVMNVSYQYKNNGFMTNNPTDPKVWRFVFESERDLPFPGKVEALPRVSKIVSIEGEGDLSWIDVELRK